MSDQTFIAIAALGVLVALAVLALPIIVAMARDIDGKADVVLLVLLLGWTGVAWGCALVLAFTRPRRYRPKTSARSGVAPQAGPRLYRDGRYLVSTGADSRTWAVHTAAGWHVVYELAGRERLVGPVPETDVPERVLADARIPRA